MVSAEYFKKYLEGRVIGFMNSNYGLTEPADNFKKDIDEFIKELKEIFQTEPVFNECFSCHTDGEDGVIATKKITFSTPSNDSVPIPLKIDIHLCEPCYVIRTNPKDMNCSKCSARMLYGTDGSIIRCTNTHCPSNLGEELL
jgi:hypothetical protein